MPGVARNSRLVAQYADAGMLAPIASTGPMNALTVDELRQDLGHSGTLRVDIRWRLARQGRSVVLCISDTSETHDEGSVRACLTGPTTRCSRQPCGDSAARVPAILPSGESVRWRGPPSG